MVRNLAVILSEQQALIRLSLGLATQGSSAERADHFESATRAIYGHLAVLGSVVQPVVDTAESEATAAASRQVAEHLVEAMQEGHDRGVAGFERLGGALLVLFSNEVAILAAISRRAEISNEQLLKMSIEVELTFEQIVGPDDDADGAKVEAAA